MSMLFEQLVATWLTTIASVTLKPSGYKSYEAICRNHLVPVFGEAPLDMITASAVQTYVANKITGGLSQRTVANHAHILRRLLAYAVDNGHLENNPAESVKAPRQEPSSTRIRYLTPDQLNLLIDSTAPAWRVLIATACMTGMRRGEQLALRFDTDIDFKNRSISISKTIRNGVVTSPKTPWSVGVVPMPESLVPLLEDRRRKAHDPDGLVFCRADGSPLPDNLPNRILARALETAGLPSVTWHEMSRHSWVVAHLQAGTDIPTLQRLGRWKTADVLLSTYAHVQPASGQHAVEAFEQMLSKEPAS